MSSKIMSIIALLGLAFAAAAILANSMTKPIEHDEQMYCTAAVLTSQGKLIYRDFSYVAQLPYHPLLCAAVFKLFNTTHYLLTVRLLSTICDVIVLLCIFAIYKKTFGDSSPTGTVFGLAAAFLYIFNPFVSYANGFAWNHDPVVACVILSLWIFQGHDYSSKAKNLKAALIGALLTLATFMRITTVLVQILFLIFFVLRPEKSKKSKLKSIACFLTAGTIVAIWPLAVILQAPESFFINVFTIPVFNGQFLHQIGMAYNKGDMLWAFIKTPSCLLLVLTGLGLLAALIKNRAGAKLTNKTDVLLAPSLTALFFIIAFIPATIWFQYFAAPIPFLIVSFARPAAYLNRIADKRYIKAVVTLTGVSACLSVLFNPVVLYKMPALFNISGWSAVRLHRLSQQIGSEVKTPKLVLTLTPLLALEGRCSIYDEFSAGVFAYRVAEFLTERQKKLTRTPGPDNVDELIQKKQPLAVITGLEPQFLEAPIIKNAVETHPNLWQRKVYKPCGLKTYNGGIVVYFKR